jgi:outer membrane lipoprotein-sorting protein
MLHGVLAAAVVLAAGEASAPSGADVIAAAQARNGFATWHDRRSVVVLEADDAGVVQRREAEVRERSDPHGEHRTVFEYLAPDDVRGTRFLHVSPRGTRDEWWTWTPATRRARRLGGTAGGLQRDEIFLGRDMNYADLELLVRIQQWTPREGTATLDGDSPCAETTCERVTLVPAPGNDEFPCARHRLWYGRTDRLLRRAELYDPDDHLMTVITCDGYFAVDGHMTARACVIEHPRTGRRVTIRLEEVAYDVGIADDVFTVAHLSEGGR